MSQSLSVRRYLIASAVVAVLFAACTSSKTPTPTPSATATAPVSASVDFKAKAGDVVDELAAGKFAAVEADFDATMKAQLPANQLQNGWRTFEEAQGTYKSHGTPVEVIQGQLHEEKVPVTTTTGVAEVRVTYHPDATVAGLFFLKAGTP